MGDLEGVIDNRPNMIAQRYQIDVIGSPLHIAQWCGRLKEILSDSRPGPAEVKKRLEIIRHARFIFKSLWHRAQGWLPPEMRPSWLDTISPRGQWAGTLSDGSGTGSGFVEVSELVAFLDDLSGACSREAAKREAKHAELAESDSTTNPPRGDICINGSASDYSQPSEASDHTEKRQDRGQVIEALLGDGGAEILRIADDKTMGAEDRMIAICRLDRTKLQEKSTFWGPLLGVKPAAVRQWDFWKIGRHKAIGALRVIEGE